MTPTRPIPVWIIVAVTAAVILLAAGVRSAPGVFVVPIEAEMGWSRAAVSGAAAFAAMWRAIPVLRPVGLMARSPPVLWVLERAYRAFLLIRPRLQALARRLTGPVAEVP